jgi:hypothetical protein
LQIGGAGALALLLFLPAVSLAADAAGAAFDSTSVGRATGFRAPFWVMMRSVAVPGWGQLYNGKWWKAALLGGAEIGFGYGIWKEDQLAKEAAERGDDADADAHWANKRSYLWWGAFSLLLSAGDAYVDAHLRGFDVEFRDEDSAILLKYEVTP